MGSKYAGTRVAETLNFLKLYMHAAGMSLVPREYHFWCALSLIAALVGDRVWVEKFKGKKLAPNLFVMLVGDSGSGKGVAIDHSISFLPSLPHLGYFRGKVTAPRLIDYMGRPHRGSDGKMHPACSKVYLCTPELSLALGAGPLADEMVKMLTELYTGGDYTFQHGTRMSGDVLVQGPCVNWIAGSAREWFLTALSPEAVRGGALARMCLIEPRASASDIVITDPIYPDDYDIVRHHLEVRAFSLAHTNGMFIMSNSARQLEQRWNTTRGYSKPENPDLLPSWRRQHALLLKLAMLLSLAEGGPLVVAKRHIEAAIPLVIEAQRPVSALVALANTGYEMRHYYFVRDTIERAKLIQHAPLLRKCSSRGITTKMLTDIIATLGAEKHVNIELGKSRGRTITWYKWLAPTWHAPDTKDEGDDDES